MEKEKTEQSVNDARFACDFGHLDSSPIVVNNNHNHHHHHHPKVVNPHNYVSAGMSL